MGSTMRQLVLQHLQGTPDVSSLPAADRTVIARALAKNPDDRYPTCVDMVRELRAATNAPARAALGQLAAEGDRFCPGRWPRRALRPVSDGRGPSLRAALDRQHRERA